MFSPDDTIVAIATPQGRGGIGVVRISGPGARAIAGAISTSSSPFEPRRATFTRVRGPSSTTTSAIDTVVVTWFPAPHSYTGQDVVEISGHGSPVVLRGIVQAAMAAGARLAEPGEFTLRSFLNGKFDLVQAEAVGDLVDAVTPLQARLAFDQLEGTLTEEIHAIDAPLFDLIARLEASLDFPDEGYHFVEPEQIADDISRMTASIDRLLASWSAGRLIREGATVVVSGRTNVGKSSLFNALAGSDRAIVTPVPGTTRDLVTERIDLDGVVITLVDTAGTREALDIVEREGVARGERARDAADLILVVLDASGPLSDDDRDLLRRTEDRLRVVVLNKTDLGQITTFEGGVIVSAATGDGLPALRTAMRSRLTGGEALRDEPMITNVRHADLLRNARVHLTEALTAAGERRPEEVLLVDLQGARLCFDEIVGRRTTDDVLAHIFERFCIGK
jgi:tRNA modification GTPase